VIVIDASLAIAGLLGAGPAQQMLEHEDLQAPTHIDVEVVGAVRRRVMRQGLASSDAVAALEVWRYLAVARHHSYVDIRRMWELRDNVTAGDAAYVALAESLGCALVTGDRRLAGTPGIRCAVTVVTG
jgi:predicted nucleic acid-binding protein